MHPSQLMSSFSSFSFPPGIVDYMSEQAGPPSKQVQAVKQVQELVKDGDDAVIVGVFADEQDAAYEIYIEACEYQGHLGNNVTKCDTKLIRLVLNPSVPQF